MAHPSRCRITIQNWIVQAQNVLNNVSYNLQSMLYSDTLSILCCMLWYAPEKIIVTIVCMNIEVPENGIW